MKTLNPNFKCSSDRRVFFDLMSQRLSSLLNSSRKIRESTRPSPSSREDEKVVLVFLSLLVVFLSLHGDDRESERE